jgi:hypothetical protein
MYIEVNNELPPIVAGIQAAHAVTGFMCMGKTVPVMQSTFKWERRYKTIILLMTTGNNLDHLMKRMRTQGIAYFAFKEPDLGKMITAVAFEPMNKKKGDKIFGNFIRYR